MASNSFFENLRNFTLNHSSHKIDLNETWKKLNINKQELKLLPLDEPIYENKIRVVCISDTHSRTNKMAHKIPDAVIDF